MTRKSKIIIHNTIYDCGDAVDYHMGAFPPGSLDLQQLLKPITETAMALTRYDTLLRTLPNSELMLAPLRARDAVVSSRMEGTISTLEEVLILEADSKDDKLTPSARNDALEVALYARALKQSERQIADGYNISDHMIRSAHRTLLGFGRGAEKRPGAYKTEQNYVGERRKRRIDFIPISPEQLAPAMEKLLRYINEDDTLPLLKTAIAHAEFEALHPFEDGNGRLGRMLITLMLWDSGVLSAPHFFVSDYFETHKEDFVERLRRVSSDGDWTGWVAFFLDALSAQAVANIELVGQIEAHYAHMHDIFRDVLRSRWSTDALNYVFANPIFRNNKFKRNAGIPHQTANKFTNRLVEEGILRVLIPPAGRATGLYAFPSLLEIVETPY